MSLNKDVIASAYPLPVYNYRVTIDSDVLSFSEVSGLSLDYENVVYKHGLSHLTGPNIIRTQQKEINVTLKRGVAAKRINLFTWMTDNAKKDIFIDLCNEKGEAVVRWKIHRAMPLKMQAPSFNAADNQTAFESLELIAQGMTLEYF